jgi:hypothetical protein
LHARPTRLAVAAILAVLVAVTIWNALDYPPGRGYDAQQHISYADGLIEHGRIPSPKTQTEYYTPPAYYALAGSATWIGRRLGLGEPHRLALALNVVLVVGTALLLLALARLLFPERPLVWVAALAFFTFLPVVVKSAAMFYPETLNTALCTAAVVVAARMLLRREYGPRWAVLLGLLLGVAQLVRVSSGWVGIAIAIAFLAAGVVRAVPWRILLRAAAIAILAAVVVTAPWYQYQLRTHTSPVSRLHSVPAAPGATAQPAGHARYLSSGLPNVFSRPYRPHYEGAGFPVTYSDTWGDYWGCCVWNPQHGPPPSGQRRLLESQSILGVLPTLLGLGGIVALLVLAVRRRSAALSLVPLVPLVAFAIYVAVTARYPNPEGDTLKATYLLLTAPFWALAFGYAVDRISRRRSLAIVLGAVLVASALVDLRALVYGSHLGGLL